MEKLTVYNKALEQIPKIYSLIRSAKNLGNDFSLCDQIKRASVSVATNIAEGYNRSPNQFRNYLHISSGSTNEVVALLQIIHAVHEIDTIKLQQEYRYLGKQIFLLSKRVSSDS